MDSVENYARRWTRYEKEDVDFLSEWIKCVDSLSEWIKCIRSMLKSRIKRLRGNMKTIYRSVFNKPEVKKELDRIHDQYELVPADKAVDSEVLFVERKPVRQNIAIQAIIQKKGQTQATEKNLTVAPSKVQERAKPPLISAEPVKTTVLTAASGLNSPKYLLGVPTTEPLFMKGTSSGVSSSMRPGTQSSRIPVTQQPPRLQKQIMAQQGSTQPSLWQENVTPQILSKQVAVTPQQQQKLLWPYSVQKQQEQNASKCDNNSSPQTTQNDASPGKEGQQPVQETTNSQKPQLLEKKTQNVFLNMNSDFRLASSCRFPGISNPSSLTPQNTSINARNPILSQSNTLSGNTTTNAMFRFPPPPFPPNSKQFSSVSFDVPPPPIPQTISMSNLEIDVRPGSSHQTSGHQHSEKNQQKPLGDNALQQNSTLVNPQLASQMANFSNNPNQQKPQNSQNSGNIGNQLHGGIRNMFPNPPPPSFQQMTPRNERPPFGGSERSPCGGTNPQPVPTQLQNSASQFHLLNQLLNAGMGRMNVRPPIMQSSKEQSGKKEDFPFVPPELLGALSQLAIQGTPIPETGNSPNRSPMPGPEVETCAGRTGLQPTQQGTYSLFSSSPWSVPLSAADNKNTGSSPFSEESNSVGSSPQSDVMDPKLPQGIDMSLRFGPTGEMWHDKTQKTASLAEQTAASGPGPYFPGPLQSIWSSPGPSPLEKLLEMQKQKRTTDPH